MYILIAKLLLSPPAERDMAVSAAPAAQWCMLSPPTERDMAVSAAPAAQWCMLSPPDRARHGCVGCSCCAMVHAVTAG